MQIGIISDIHGDLANLTAALAIFRREQVDRVVCAGDLVDFGAWGDEVVQHIFEAGIPCVCGNHDRDAAERQRLRLNHSLHSIPDKPLLPETLDRLAQLPPMLRYTWEGVRVLLTHANTWGDDASVHIRSTPALFRRVIDVSEADITIIGHTHQPMWIESAGRMILNPGSVSVNYTCLFGTCAILSLPERQFRLLNVETGEDVTVQPQRL